MFQEEKILNSKILIIDDQPVNVLLLQKLLENKGYTSLHSTTDSRKASQMYSEIHPDLVLLDLNMPHLDGFQVMEQLQELEKESYAPILILTAQNAKEVRLKALKKGAKDYLSKPFDVTEVLCRIQNLLEVRLLHNQVCRQNKVLDQKVRERTEELNQTRLEIIIRLGRAGEYRDNETGMHVVRMSKISTILARKVGMSENECELVLNASPMHDIGKIGIPDNILLKPGKLNPEEWKVMKSHVEIGAEILSGNDSQLIQMARLIALQHHEKWNGNGYPNALKGETISQVARIVTIADVFDALTSERPYKKSWPMENVLSFFNEQSGEHFDPYLVKKFQEILPEILEIKETYPDTGDSKLNIIKEKLITPVSF
jgi:putative two-component system response regulator